MTEWLGMSGWLCYHEDMKIEWNKVTWYSKMFALALFVLLPIIAFWFGVNYEHIRDAANSYPGPQASVSSGQSDYYTNVAEWQTDTPYSTATYSGNAGWFSIAYPIDFAVDDNVIAPTPEWSQYSSEADAGYLYFTLTIPKVFEPQTNFAEAKLTVGSSLSSGAVLNCLSVDANGGSSEATSTVTINGIPFIVFRSASAGAGNLYETTSYRTLHAKQCYAIEYTIHSSQIANYPAEYNLKPFDKQKLSDVLDRIVGTFKFK